VVFWLRILGTGNRLTTGIAIGVSIAGIALAETTDLHHSGVPPAPVGNLLVIPMVLSGAGLGWRAGLSVVSTLAILTIGVDLWGRLSVTDTFGDVLQFWLMGLLSIGSRLAVISARELERAREHLARLAVAEERLRFARDLHDLLGHRLASMALRLDTVGNRLTPETIQAQRAEVYEVATIARTALVEVRHVVTGYRRAGLEAELEDARLELTSVGIETTIINSAGVVPPAASEVLGWSLREAVTNVIKHSGARRCSMQVKRDGGMCSKFRMTAVLRTVRSGRTMACAGSKSARSWSTVKRTSLGPPVASGSGSGYRSTWDLSPCATPSSSTSWSHTI